MSLVVVVAGCALVLKGPDVTSQLSQGGEPRVLRLGGRLHLGDVVVERVSDEIGHVAACLVEEVRVVHGEPALGVAEEEHVRKAVNVHAVEGPHGIGPVRRKAVSPRSDYLVPGPAGVAGADFEAGGEDKAVELIFLITDDEPRTGDPFHPAAVGVHQDHVGAVEGLEVLVMEARALAELPVPGLECIRSVAVVDDRIDASTDLFHLLEVGRLQEAGGAGGLDIRTPTVA